jgi:hypothetical protein
MCSIGRAAAQSGRTQRVIVRLCSMSSSQSLTTTEMLGFRTLAAMFLRFVAGLFGGEWLVRNVRRGAAGRTAWLCACPVFRTGAEGHAWLRTLLVPVPWHDTSGGRDGPNGRWRSLSAFYLDPASRYSARPTPGTGPAGPSQPLI